MEFQLEISIPIENSIGSNWNKIPIRIPIGIPIGIPIEIPIEYPINRNPKIPS